MRFGRTITEVSINHPRTVTLAMVLSTLLIAAVAALPSLWPTAFPMLHPVAVDTDPENMLSEDEPVRVFHDQMKHEMALYDMVVVGVVNEKHPQGVFNPDSLRRIYELTEFARTLRWKDPRDPEKSIGVIEVDLIAPSTVDNIEQGGPGVVRFEWLMAAPPATQEEAEAVRRKAERIPFLNGTLVSEDGKAICLYLPLTSKTLSYRVYSALRGKIATMEGDEQYHITGLPVAEDTFGVEMFKQMAISAPIAMLIIFVLMLIFFRKLMLVLSPMIVAMVSVIVTMGLLVAAGQTVHIMSSMIPIFIMPIAVLDSVHILSEFFDRYQKVKDRRRTVLEVMETLFTPMIYTSLTTAVAFLSLALTPIPPVQVFGIFVAAGVLVAWIWTVAFIPAFIMFIPERSLASFGLTHHEDAPHEDRTLMGRILSATGRMTFRRARVILLVTAIVAGLAILGITRIRINDNPVKWFNRAHPIRQADEVLNRHFGGTYMAYLALQAPDGVDAPDDFAARLEARAKELADPKVPAVFAAVRAQAESLAASGRSGDERLDALDRFANEKAAAAEIDQLDAWSEAALFIGQERQRSQIFKQPEALRYIARLQAHLQSSDVVGKSNSLADIVQNVHRELLSGEQTDYRIPASPEAVAQTLTTYQSSHRPQDLWHFVTPDFRKSVLWVQLKSGDNRDMSRVVASLEEYVRANPPPFGVTTEWFGLTYINVIWQEKMVWGMFESFLGSFLAVLLMMTLLYGSALWGLLSMIPLTVTIGLIYGMIGFIGKDYDMPVAVLSALSLGLAVDYAIHFLSRSRELRAKHGTWEATAGPVFGEPARAVSRNVIVIGVGFLPLLAAPLVPYKTVGVFIASILLTAGIATLLILPALITVLEPLLFPKSRIVGVTCRCATCVVSAVTLVALVAVNVRQFLAVGWTRLSWVSLVAVVGLAGLCALFSRRESCRTQPNAESVNEGGTQS